MESDKDEVAARKAANKQFTEVKNMMGSQQVKTPCILTLGKLFWLRG